MLFKREEFLLNLEILGRNDYSILRLGSIDNENFDNDYGA